MGILLIDTSSKKIEFGYVGKNPEEFLIKAELEPENNADTLTCFMKRAFEEKGIDLKEIEYVSLSNGPGSFTGLRIGSAIAKGICFALDSKLIEIPTLDIIAAKLIRNFPEIINNDEREIVSMIFSNSRTMEFYYCRFKNEAGKIIRLSDYKIDLLENIIKADGIFVINENKSDNIDKEYLERLIDLSGQSNLDSQYELARDLIRINNFVDFNTSEPFYMKEFVPVTKN